VYGKKTIFGNSTATQPMATTTLDALRIRYFKAFALFQQIITQIKNITKLL
jgi:hypothetical protein